MNSAFMIDTATLVKLVSNKTTISYPPAFSTNKPTLNNE